LSYRGHTKTSYANHRKNQVKNRKRKHPFPKKRLDQIVGVERKLEDINNDIDFGKFADISDDVSHAQTNLWKAITKADKTRTN
jgi:hypothetical protein